jgi:hypothetical protein
MVWNIIPTKFRISQSINSTLQDTSCSLCSSPIDSILHLFFFCPIARVVWRQFFWPIDSLALPVQNITDWLLIFLNPATIGIPQTAAHMFKSLLRWLVINYGSQGIKLIMINLCLMLLLF